MSEQLIIAGFHRSGTSAVAQLLHRAGLFLGDELVAANPSNMYGHFEDWEVVNLHNAILADNDATWLVGESLLPVVNRGRWQEMRRIAERRNAEHRLWGFKDPRVCPFIMPWKYLLPDAKVLLVYRHFADATYSLARRHSGNLFQNRGSNFLHRRFWEEPDLALRMWLVHNRALLVFACAYPEDTLTVSLGTVLAGFPLVWALNRRWDLGLREVPVGAVLDTSVLEGRVGRQPVSDRRLIPEVVETWDALEELGAETERIIDGEEEGVREFTKSTTAGK